MALSRNEVRRLLDSHQLGPSRALGQNFLCDRGMVDKIVRLSGIDEENSVLEIGPGLGSLTVGLCETGARVTAVEIDQYLIPALRESVGSYERSGQLRIVNQDVRELDWPEIVGDRDWTVVANLPYNIATPLILDLVAQQPRLSSWMVMVQREAGERLVAEPGSKIYGIPSVLLAYWATARLVGSVSAELFFPKPKVESVLVKIVRRSETATYADFDAVAKLVRTGFGQRRKMLRRSLAAVVSTGQFEQAGIDSTRRPEQLHLDEWRRLASVLT